MKFTSLFFLFFVLLAAKSLHATNPIDLLKRKFPIADSTFQIKKYKGIADGRSAFSKYNPVTLFFNGSMYIYQKAISEQISAECGFTPSCSEFSKLLIRRYGLFKGIFLSADRLMRDNGQAGEEHPSSWMDVQTGKVIDSTDYYRWLNNF